MQPERNPFARLHSLLRQHVAGNMPAALLAGSLLLSADADGCNLVSEEFFEEATLQEVKRCIQAGHDVNGRDDLLGLSPLHLALWNSSDPGIIAALLEAGAEVNGRTEEGFTPLLWAIRNSAATNMITVLLAAGAEVSSRDRGGFTPLHWAVIVNAETDTIVALLEAGAEVNVRTAEGFTPLHLASMGNHPEADIIATLLEAGADPGLADKTGRIPSYYTTEKQRDKDGAPSK